MTRRGRRALVVAVCLLAPNFLGFLIFTAGPVFFSFIMAFTNWDLTVHTRHSAEPIRFVGLDNFRKLLFGEEWRYFGKYLYNTVYLMIGIPIGIALSLMAALLLNKPLSPARGRRGAMAVALTVALTAVAAGATALTGGPAPAVFLIFITGGLVLLGQLLGRVSFRTLFYLPNLTAGVAIYILWKALYNPESGPINLAIQPALDALAGSVRATPALLWPALGWLVALLAAALLVRAAAGAVLRLRDRDIGLTGFFFSVLAVGAACLAVAGVGYVLAQLPGWVAAEGGLTAPKWLVSMRWAKPAIMIMGIFAAMGSNNMLLYLAALSNVPPELYEAASIDGANRSQTFWNVTWPQLAPTTFFIVVMSVIGGLQGGFEQARIMTNGGPAGSTTTLSYYLYLKGFTDFQLGFASAIAWAMFIMIFVITLFNWRFGNRMVND